jgi:cytoskeletal protein CcmA (bactofilin family)
MLAFTNSREKTSPTIIGAGCVVNGDLNAKHSVQIHGAVFGTIAADTVVIGRGGRVVGKVIAHDLFLHGLMDGPATVDTANIFSNAQMTGTLSYRTLNISANTGLDCTLSKRREKSNAK